MTYDFDVRSAAIEWVRTTRHLVGDSFSSAGRPRVLDSLLDSQTDSPTRVSSVPKKVKGEQEHRPVPQGQQEVKELKNQCDTGASQDGQRFKSSEVSFPFSEGQEEGRWKAIQKKKQPGGKTRHHDVFVLRPQAESGFKVQHVTERSTSLLGSVVALAKKQVAKDRVCARLLAVIGFFDAGGCISS